MTAWVTVSNKRLCNDDVKKYDLGLESQNQDRIYLPFASYKGDILARAYEVIYWSTYREGLWFIITCDCFYSVQNCDKVSYTTPKVAIQWLF